MKYAMYLAIFLHFARKTVRKLTEGKDDGSRKLEASLAESGIKIYSDMYADPSKCLVGYKGYSNMPHKVAYSLRYVYTDDGQAKYGSLKPAYDICKDIVQKNTLV